MTDLRSAARGWLTMFGDLDRSSRTVRIFSPFLKALLRMYEPVPFKVRLIILLTGRIPSDYIEETEDK